MLRREDLDAPDEEPADEVASMSAPPIDRFPRLRILCCLNPPINDTISSTVPPTSKRIDISLYIVGDIVKDQ